ncbi:SacI homology domain-containing protein [Auriculariales sp. MPI-PUGE-AT-0066]|nr:SacI homology domain-containing protein [Auriculariales sp. MPI-PUGE-AT-0066]
MFKVRRLFSAGKRTSLLAQDDTPKLPSGVDSAAVSIAASQVHMPPRLAVPPSPHPLPHEQILVTISDEGLLLRPNVDNADSYVRIAWGKSASPEEIDGPGNAQDWVDAVFVYGIVGVLRLFSGKCCLSRYHSIYSVKHVSAIQLDKDGASKALASIRSLNVLDRSASHALSHEASEALPDDAVAVPIITEDLATPVVEEEVAEPDQNAEPKTPHVRFASEVDLREAMRDQLRRPSSPVPSSSSASSGRSSPTSGTPAMSPVSKALAERMSFWNMLPKRPLPKSASAASPAIDTGRWFTKPSSDQPPPSEVVETIAAAMAPAPATADEQNKELEIKIVRETVRLFSKGGMYFSYAFDLTTPIQRKRQQVLRNRHRASLLQELDALDNGSGQPHDSDEIDVLAEPQANLPLWRRADTKFWWNSALIQPFVDAGLHPYVLPIMQGYIQIASFGVPAPEAVDILGSPVAESPVPNVEGASDAAENVAAAVTSPVQPTPQEQVDWVVPVDYIVVSRRSRDRAGLRYQRRGIDDDANVANFVETEVIMRIRVIPLFWKQPGYSLKPAPQLSPDRTHAQNLDAISRHLERTVRTYGPHNIVNLAEQHGKEGAVTQAYKEYVTEMANDNVNYDFHAETKGMKYENIAKLITQLERTFETQGFLWVSEKTTLSEQRGVFRVNCIDCLDRTNVVQSAFARYVLHKQLETLALLNEGESKTDADVIFNDVWANNGDAISHEYAGTSALKGDFTRTGKRDITGMLNDGVNSLARVYSSTFSDWFSQTVIDYVLGNRAISVFSEFLHNLASTDPRELLRISKVREAAIETCTARVLNEDERLLSGWTLFSPVDLNTRISNQFEEKVLLLTAKALYIVSYDYNLEKVKVSTRIPLGDIVGLRKGSYILSTLDETSRDPEQNYGLVVAYLPTNQDTRLTSYSVRNSVNPATIPLPASAPSTPGPTSESTFGRRISLRRNPSALSTSSQTTAPTASGVSRRISMRPSASRQSTNMLSRILTNVAVGSNSNDVICAAFKALPVDSSKARRGSTLAGAPFKDPLNCKEAVDSIVDTIRDACAEVGAVQAESFITEKDIVSLAEAQSTTTVYSKLEYGIKRLLWLGR